MATLPNALSLTSIADGAPVIAADPRNNFAAIQTDVNALLTILGSGVTGQMLTGNGTTVSMAYPPGYSLGYNEITAGVTIASTTEASGTTIIAAPAITFDGTDVEVEFFSPVVNLPSVAGATLFICLFEGATEIGRMGGFQAAAASASAFPVFLRRRFTPTAAAHTYTVTAFASSLTGGPSIAAGSGGAGGSLPAYVRVRKV